MRMRAGAVLVALLLAACGGGGGDDDGDDEAVEVATEAVVAIDPCGVMDADAASDLVGGDVEEADAEVGTSLAHSIGCSYHLADADAEDGSAIAASLVMAETDEDPEAAVEQRIEELGGDPDAAEPVDLGGDTDAAAVTSDDVAIQVVYVIDDVVTSIEILPVDGVDDEKVQQVVDFAEETVEPVKEAVEEKQRVEDEEGTGSQEPDAETVQAAELEGLWTGDWGTMAIEEDGGEVRAAYTHDEGRITGTFEDGVFTGRWTEVPSREGPHDAGDVEFRFSKGAGGTIILDGRWDYDGDAEPLAHDDWDLTLSEEDVPPELLAAFDDEESFEAP